MHALKCVWGSFLCMHTVHLQVVSCPDPFLKQADLRSAILQNELIKIEKLEWTVASLDFWGSPYTGVPGNCPSCPLHIGNTAPELHIESSLIPRLFFCKV